MRPKEKEKIIGDIMNLITTGDFDGAMELIERTDGAGSNTKHCLLVLLKMILMRG